MTALCLNYIQQICLRQISQTAARNGTDSATGNVLPVNKITTALTLTTWTYKCAACNVVADILKRA